LGAAHDSANRSQKLKHLYPLLRCPICQRASSEWQRGTANATCSCGNSIVIDGHYNFLSESVRSDYALADTDNISENQYDGEITDLINRCHKGWVLDCGAGKRSRYYDHVVNYEIVAYDSTDVLGLGENLPFQDNSFDAVLSCAVLEHVKDPFTCAQEIVRVLKPGGRLYCQVPFLQPFHGYPDHYYNMTSSGLKNLFGDRLDIDCLEAMNYGQPITALSWILSSYSQALPEPTREAFLNMRVSDLLAPTGENLLADHVALLPPETVDSLACCNLMIATKKRIN
jgi:SAM-dependent methyltransferase